MIPIRVTHGRYVLLDMDQVAPRVRVDGAKIDLWVGDRLIGSVVEERETVLPSDTAEVIRAFAMACIEQDRNRR
jgi:hypothetical protein